MIRKKRPESVSRKGVVFRRDNARPHASLEIRQKFLQLEWDVSPRSPYSPSPAPSDFHLFRSLRNSSRGKVFDTSTWISFSARTLSSMELRSCWKAVNDKR
ncbi:Histone-lysine N-methyltransferase SETMAR [Melipona quadrifasciata]|uniref:Histone-lysine N-methyltransferase SETMAR n=1 Tax=Melipona quadrifasciata TaxID=166423 RepID=A0A0M8ZWG2_9HYME|nr:Histone-lysine N-methyltransferase SETMAR [Melipona quadrifasciata]